MNFNYDQDILDLRDGTRGFLRQMITPEYLRQQFETNNSSFCWEQLIEMGLLSSMVSEDKGGLGMRAVDFCLIAEECGYVALPEPLIEMAAVVLPLLEKMSNDNNGLTTLINQVLQGKQGIRCIHPDNLYLNQSIVSEQDKLLVIDVKRSYLIDMKHVNLSPQNSIDPLRKLFKVESDITQASYVFSETDSDFLYHEARHYGAIFTASELVGLTQALMDMAKKYALERQQFGKVIGSFQAIKHHFADVFIQLEFVRPVIQRAAYAIQYQQPIADKTVAHAKVFAIDTAIQTAETAIQIYGAMGYTYEVDLHLWMKRVWAIAGQWGDRNDHMNLLGEQLLNDECVQDLATTFIHQ